MSPFQNKWAVVTGASSGIGAELARELAARGAHLVLTARRKPRLDELAARLHAAHGVNVEVCPADLAQPNAALAIHGFTQAKGIAVEILVNNAGFGAYGPFAQSDVSRQLEMIHVNISAVVHLTHLYLLGMIERRRGHILTVASTAGFQGVPFLAVYAATKSFDLFFSEALAAEVRPFGVRVTALCPGSTSTEYQAVAGQPDFTFRQPESAAKVARVGLDALAAGKSMVISGARNRLMIEGQRLAPRGLVASITEKMFRPR